MKTIREHKYLKCYFDDTNLLFYYEWLPTAVDATEDDVKSMFQLCADVIVEYKPDIILGDNRNQCTISVEEQREYAEIWVRACVQAGVKKFAIVLPAGLIEALSLEQTMDEGTVFVEGEVQGCNFVSMEEARKWLGI